MKKIFSFFAMALFAMTAFAQTQKFVAADVFIKKVYYAPGWNAILNVENLTTADAQAYNNSVSSYDVATGVFTANLSGAACVDRWQAQFFLSTGIHIQEGKQYDIAFTVTSTAAVGSALFQIAGADLEYTPTVGTYNFTRENINLATAWDGVIVLDFGHTVANNTVTVSNISIIEHDPVIETVDYTQYMELPVYSNSTQQSAANGCDGNAGTRWESKSADGDNVFWMVNYGEAKEFNRIKILWEGAYGKTYTIYGSNDCVAWDSIAGVVDKGMTATEIFELSSTVSYQYVRFQGIKRGTGYGYSFFEFETYVAQTSVLSNLDFTAAAVVSAIGGTVNLTATPKDQYNLAMEAEVTYAVTPIAAGHVTNGVYTADAAGLATITATAGEFSKTVTVFNYEGENVALNKTVTGEGFNDAARVNDGNEGTEYQADSRNGGNPKEWDAEFVIDLGAAYDLNLVTIKFEGACSDAYTLETSADNVNFAVAYNYSGTNGINGHTDFLYGENLANAAGVRYIKFHSTKNATDWGCKIFELKAFGVEHVSTSLEDVDTVETVKFIQNGQLFIMKNGVLYNALGVRL